MADFRTKLFGLTFSALTFAGMAFGQATCNYSPGSPNAVIAKGEETTAQVAPVSITCTAGPLGSVAGAISIQDFLGAPVTSKVLSTTGVTAGSTEAIAVTPSGTTFGTIGVGGSTINFSGVPVPALAAAATYTIVISNVRVNATTIALGTGAPPPIGSSVFITGGATVLVPASLAAVNVAFVQAGIGSRAVRGISAGAISATAGGVNFVVCTGYTPVAGTALSTILVVSEGFQTSFKTAANEAPQVAIAAGAVVAGSVSNAVASGTRIKIAFNNVPNNVAIYLPITLTAAAGGVLSMTTSETGAYAAVTPLTPSTSNGLLTSAGATFAQPGVLAAAPTVNSVGLAPVTISGGSGVAVYEVIVDGLATLDTFNIGAWIFTTANTVSGSSTAINEAVSFAPVGSTNIPNFAVTSSTSTLAGSTFNICTTSLIFPFVTNQLGFDTGIAISNTSADPFGTTRGATPQSGTCTLNFYGDGAPTPSSVATPTIQAGKSYAFQSSSVAAGFQGYLIVQCNFLFAHGMALIAGGPNAGISQGYLPGVIPDTNQINRGTVPTAGTTVGEFLGN